MPAVFGLIFSGLPMVMSLLILTPLQTAVLCIVGSAVVVLGIRMGRKPGYAAGARGKATPGQDGKWVWGGAASGRSSGSRGSSGSSGSSGFGGGRSGGGGASGRW